MTERKRICCGGKNRILSSCTLGKYGYFSFVKITTLLSNSPLGSCFMTIPVTDNRFSEILFIPLLGKETEILQKIFGIPPVFLCFDKKFQINLFIQ